MWKCHKCGKPVYFAERKTSLGYEWHPECLRCEECGKRLNPGQHAEHKGVPYCHIPCYSVLFGPTLFGHGSQVEAHTSFGKIENRQGTPVPRSHLEAKLRVYNSFFDGKSGTVQSRERNGRLILEGSLRIYWGVNKVIHLKEDHDDRMPVRRRNSVQICYDSRVPQKESHRNVKALSAGEKSAIVEKDPNLLNSLLSLPMNESAVPLSEIDLDVKTVEKDAEEETATSPSHYKTLPAGGIKSTRSDNTHPIVNDNTLKDSCGNVVQLRRKPRVQKSKLKRRCSINGHFYNRETSVFMPAYASITSVWVTSLVTGPEVINMLLDKFKVVNNPGDFALYVVRDTGERRCIQEHEYPLLVRVMLGPSEDVAKVFIMNRYQTEEVTCEVAQYIKFSETELKMFLHKFNEEEKREERKITLKYQQRRRWMQARLEELKEIQETGL
ncbi:ras association domain-containing protein 2-like [Uloborus diversus]|uniref:ras association domain-containing protein 2-like n=1 Tax=Uloborus diversus TaxID=327109 RepID=UPI00240A4212|nr:ras association domain-containing protein 2-like [Uloborus diversus]